MKTVAILRLFTMVCDHMSRSPGEKSTWRDWIDYPPARPEFDCFLKRGSMTKQMKAALAAMMLICTLPLMAQTDGDSLAKLRKDIDEPATLHYKGVQITPVGFAAAESVFRSRAMNADVNTPFSSVPYGNSTQAYLSEFNASGRQSRLGLFVTAPTPLGKFGAYYEMDFLGAGTTSNNNQSNSYLFRQRQAWAQASTTSGFTITGGQMWSLVTEVKKGIINAPGGENLPNTVDAQYHVGFSWARQYGVRASQQLGPNAAIAIALEGSQTVLAGMTNAPYNFILGAEGNTSGLLTSTGNGSSGAPGAQNYSDNVAPDVIVKFTADSKMTHFEIGGVARFFRERYYPTIGFTTAAATSVPSGSATNMTSTGGGFFLNGRVKATPFVDLGIHIMQGTGVARYGTSNLGDVIAKPLGGLEPLRSSQGLLSIETHPTKKLDVYGYAGGEYLQRTYYTTSLVSGTNTIFYNVGYAPLISTYTVATATPNVITAYTLGQNDAGCNIESPPSTNNGYPTTAASSCSGTTRAVIEGSFGFTYRLYSSPKFGRLQYQMVYSYLTKEGWTGVATGSAANVLAGTAVYGGPKATDNMVFTGLRYYIP